MFVGDYWFWRRNLLKGSQKFRRRANHQKSTQVREAEMVQAIDRLRLIHSERQKTVCILCNIPLDIPVDGLVTWRQLIGDNRLAQALETCEEKGWNALPFAASELTELFPA